MVDELFCQPIVLNLNSAIIECKIDMQQLGWWLCSWVTTHPGFFIQFLYYLNCLLGFFLSTCDQLLHLRPLPKGNVLNIVILGNSDYFKKQITDWQQLKIVDAVYYLIMLGFR